MHPELLLFCFFWEGGEEEKVGGCGGKRWGCWGGYPSIMYNFISFILKVWVSIQETDVVFAKFDIKANMVLA